MYLSVTKLVKLITGSKKTTLLYFFKKIKKIHDMTVGHFETLNRIRDKVKAKKQK